MYLPEHFAEERLHVLHELIAEHPLGTLVTQGADGLTADHIPFLLEATVGEHGRLIGHCARRNDLWRTHPAAKEALVVFQCVSAYISPNWYETKRVTHEVVPTYNYAVVHVHGPVIVHEDARWLRGVVGKLTRAMETASPKSWKMADAPGDFIDSQLEQIVGLEIPISLITGKWKVSQNRPVADRLGAVDGLRKRDHRDDRIMAAMISAQLGDD